MEIGATKEIPKRLKNQEIHPPYDQTDELAFCCAELIARRPYEIRQ